ncbi:manganese-binding transcriptional regulator MntR [Aeoliella straminimaris]
MTTRHASPTMAPSEKRASNEFRRTRHDHATETAEDYVEAVAQIEDEAGECRGADLARLFAVSHVTVTKTIARLKDEGLVDTRPYGPITLTTRGRRLARDSQRRHDLVVEFLKTIGVSDETARIDAEGIEHHVSKETLKCFQKIVEGQR